MNKPKVSQWNQGQIVASFWWLEAGWWAIFELTIDESVRFERSIDFGRPVDVENAEPYRDADPGSGLPSRHAGIVVSA